MTTTPNDEVYCLVLLVDSDVAYCQQVRQAFEQHNRQFAQRGGCADGKRFEEIAGQFHGVPCAGMEAGGAGLLVQVSESEEPISA